MVIKDLASKDFGTCGTLRMNRKEVPQAIQKAKLKAGMAPVFVHQNDDSWFDKQQVKLVTNLHDELMIQCSQSNCTDELPIIFDRFRSQLLSRFTFDSWAMLTKWTRSYGIFQTVLG